MSGLVSRCIVDVCLGAAEALGECSREQGDRVKPQARTLSVDQSVWKWGHDLKGKEIQLRWGGVF